MNTRYLGLTTGSQNVSESPTGVDFDGTTDYLSRSTDLTGNVDSKTFTFSAWVYIAQNVDKNIMFSTDGVNKSIDINTSTTAGYRIELYNSAGVRVFGSQTDNGLKLNTFANLLVSADLTNTTKRHIYLNDILVGSYNTYTNDTIDFTKSTFYIASEANTKHFKGRLSHVFLDYTYRDLSIEANRRLFITADGKPASGLASLNPILYLPMKDASTAHINDGTGGNFVQNGTLDTASRGANQDNCVASYFDGVADYLKKVGNMGIANGKSLVVSFSLKNNSTEASGYPAIALALYKSTGSQVIVSCTIGNDGNISISAQKTDGTSTGLTLPSGTVSKRLKTTHVSASFNNATGQKCIIVDGVDKTSLATFSYSNLDIILSSTEAFISGGNGITPSAYYTQTVGELYFNTTYIDLATSNPFWDATENKPKPVRQVIKETGVTPLIAMPLDASNAGKNYGTGGDFTVNSGPYIGARGASEFWARSAKFDGTTGYLSRTTGVGAINSKTFSLVFAFNMTTNADRLISMQLSNGLGFILGSIGNRVRCIATNSSGSDVLDVTANTTALTTGTWYIVEMMFDLSSTSLRKIYINGIDQSCTYSLYSNQEIGFGSFTRYTIGAQWNGSSYTTFANASEAMCYFTTDYIDFSLESERNKFISQLGYPRDLKPLIESGEIPNPLIYLPFDDTSNLGKNLGTGGDFTTVGTVTAGSDVLG